MEWIYLYAAKSTTTKMKLLLCSRCPQKLSSRYLKKTSGFCQGRKRMLAVSHFVLEARTVYGRSKGGRKKTNYAVATNFPNPFSKQYCGASCGTVHLTERTFWKLFDSSMTVRCDPMRGFVSCSRRMLTGVA